MNGISEYVGAADTGEWAKARATESDNLCLIPRSHEGESQLPTVLTPPQGAAACTHP